MWEDQTRTWIPYDHFFTLLLSGEFKIKEEPHDSYNPNTDLIPPPEEPGLGWLPKPPTTR